MIRIAILEDNPSDQQRLTAFLDRFFAGASEDYQSDLFPDGESFMKSATKDYDLIFFDIELGNENGMDIARRVRAMNSRVGIVFVTNLREYAINGYEVGAINYILKPIQYAGFSLTMERACKAMETKKDIILRIPHEGSTLYVDARDILYIDIVRHDVVVHTEPESYFFYGSLNEFEAKLANSGFARCSSNTLVNLRFVRKIDKNDVFIGSEVLHLSRRMKKEFSEKLALVLGEQL